MYLVCHAPKMYSKCVLGNGQLLKQMVFHYSICVRDPVLSEFLGQRYIFNPWILILALTYCFLLVCNLSSGLHFLSYLYFFFPSCIKYWIFLIQLVINQVCVKHILMNVLGVSKNWKDSYQMPCQKLLKIYVNTSMLLYGPW